MTWRPTSKIEILPGTGEANSGPHAPRIHADEIELMPEDDMAKKTDEQAMAEEHAQVSGFQEGVAYPVLPETPEEFQQLLDNPDKPAENQSAPPPEKLNPHLFGPQGRL